MVLRCDPAQSMDGIWRVYDIFLRWPTSEGSVIQQMWRTTVMSLLGGRGFRTAPQREKRGTSIVSANYRSLQYTWRSWRRKRNWEKGNGFRGNSMKGASCSLLPLSLAGSFFVFSVSWWLQNSGSPSCYIFPPFIRVCTRSSPGFLCWTCLAQSGVSPFFHYGMLGPSLPVRLVSMHFIFPFHPYLYSHFPSWRQLL